MVTTDYWATTSGADQPDEWEALLSATHLPWRVDVPAPQRQRGFRAWAQRMWIDDLALVDCECGPCSGSRRRTQLAATDGAFVVVLFTLHGRETVEQDGTQADLRSGDAVLWDSGRAARFAVWSPLSKRSLPIPRAALDEVGGRAQVAAGTMLDGRSPPVRLLRGYLDTLQTTLPDLDPSAVTAARNATLELLVGALHRSDDVPTAGSSRPARAPRWTAGSSATCWATRRSPRRRSPARTGFRCARSTACSAPPMTP
jgi:AraC family transcriptional activator of tynA and feaB